MKKLLIECKRCAVVLLALAAAFAVGCTDDLKDDLNGLNDKYDELEDQYSSLEDQIKDLEAKLDGNQTVVKIEGETIYFSNGTSLELDEMTIYDETTEFYVLSVGDTKYVAYKEGVIFPENISLPSFDEVAPLLIKDKEYTFSFLVDPTNATVTPSNAYLVAYEKNPTITKGIVDGEESAEETPHGDSNEVIRMKLTGLEDKGDGVFYVSGVWTAADWSDLDLDDCTVRLSVEYPKHYWDAEASEVVRGYEYRLSDDVLDFNEDKVAITEADVVANELDDNDDAVPFVYHVAEGDKLTFDIQSMIAGDFISANINSAYLTSSTGFTQVDLSISSTTWDVDGKVDNKDVSVYTNTTGENAKLVVTAPTVTGDQEFTTAYLVFDDALANTDANGNIYDSNGVTDKYYKDIYGERTEDEPAEKDIVTKGYVSRLVKINVYDTPEIAMDGLSKKMIPNGVDGSVSVSFNTGDDEKSGNTSYTEKGFSTVGGEYATGKNYSISYGVEGSEIAYTQNESRYGYILGYDEDAYEAYAKYVEENADTFVVASTPKNKTYNNAYDMAADIKLANTADQPILPGKYDVTTTYTVTYSDVDGNVVFTKKMKYTQSIYLYAPQYTVELASTVGTNSMGENAMPAKYSGDIAAYKGTDIKEFITYEWYDFDLARLVSVNKLSSSNEIGAATAYDVDAIDVSSTTYSDAQLALYDYNNGEYVGARFLEKDATSTLVGTTTPWYRGFHIDVEGQDEVTNVINIDAPAVGTNYVTKKITMYQALSSGLKIPVKLVTATSSTVTTSTDVMDDEDKGSMLVTVKFNGIKTNEVKDDAIKSGSNTYSFATVNLGSSYSSALDKTTDGSKSIKISLADNTNTGLREVSTYPNLLKSSFNFAEFLAAQSYGTSDADKAKAYYILKGKKMFAKALDVTLYPTCYLPYNGLKDADAKVRFTGNAYSDNQVAQTYTDSFKSYIVLEDAAISTVAEFDALSADLQKTYAAKYENEFVGDVYTTATGTIKAAQLVSQVGNGSADRSSTVNLISSVSYSTGSLYLASSTGTPTKVTTAPMVDQELIAVDEATGVITLPNVTTNTTGNVYMVPVIVTITDVAGNTCHDIVEVYIKY